MSSFDKIHSGITGLDKAIDFIRLGDNVVWQVTDIEEYSFFAEQFMKQSIKEKRNLIYVRFAQHKALLKNQRGFKIINLDASVGFESFTIKVHELIKKEGQEAFYIFDSISELQFAWSADLMMGNFFVVTCPYLFELNTVAYFGIIRGRHSFDTIARIRETTQVLLDVYSDNNDFYIHPLKVWKRYSNTMFLPHKLEKNNINKFTTLSGGLDVSKFYSLVEKNSSTISDQNLDNWDKFFLEAKLNISKSEKDIKKIKKIISEISERIIGKEKKIIELIQKHFDIKDLLDIKDRMIGSGKIGGKATGMLLARKIIKNLHPEIYVKLEPHDSFYIGSDIYYTYLVQNDCWKLKIAQKTEKNYFSYAKKLKQKILSGTFSEKIKEQFRRILEYYGQNPIIIRSSSLLEDSFENSFAGKYLSVFCVNNGDINKRLGAFENAVKQVYASTMDKNALEYRLLRGLSKSDEQMALLVQRVSGLRFANIFMPCAAGVGYSYNSYCWHKEINPKDGMIRLVIGLGTRAVERTEIDYPRLISLSNPNLIPFSDYESRSEFSQHYIDVLNLRKNSFTSINLNELLSVLPKWYKNLMLEHDYEAERILKQRGKDTEVLFVTCDELIRINNFTSTLKNILHYIQQEYNYPVDIEFTINLSEDKEFLINILQCRPLQVGGVGGKVDIPKKQDEEIFFELYGNTMGGSIIQPIDIVIQIDPENYYKLPYNSKYSIARIIGAINQYFKNSKKIIMLLAPGRIGTNFPELGIPVSFSEISKIKILCEVSYKKAGYIPELSYGSHFFQDLVESNIFYVAIFENDNTVKYKADFFKNLSNILPSICPDYSQFENVINVYDVSNIRLTLFSDIITNKTLCAI